jgi:hypothetical protein
MIPTNPSVFGYPIEVGNIPARNNANEASSLTTNHSELPAQPIAVKTKQTQAVQFGGLRDVFRKWYLKGRIQSLEDRKVNLALSLAYDEAMKVQDQIAALKEELKALENKTRSKPTRGNRYQEDSGTRVPQRSEEPPLEQPRQRDVIEELDDLYRQAGGRTNRRRPRR